MSSTQQIKSFIDLLDVPASLKLELGNEQLLLQHSLYLNLVYYAAPAFPPIDAVKLASLQGYSYLYFRTLLGLDSLLDGTGGTAARAAERLLASFALHEQAVRGLAELFPATDDFWPAFARCKAEYAAANLLEKQQSAAKAAYTLASFEHLAAGKSAVCYALVYALRSLGGDAGPVHELRQCLLHLHIGMQCLDDVDDFRKDWQAGQVTYAHSLLLQRLQEAGVVADELTPEQLHRYLYTTGVAQQLLSLGSQHYSCSLTLAQALGLSDFAEYIQQQLRKCRLFEDDVDRLLLKTKIKASKSAQLLQPAIQDVAVADALQQALHASLRYLSANREDDGCWTDFMTSAGQSKLWVTAYTGLQLAEVRLGAVLAHEAFNVSYYLPNSYNDSILQDGDSTNFAMGLRYKAWGEATDAQLQNWLSFMNADGGWVTYQDAERLRKRLELPPHVPVDAWLSPKLCVTAAAAYVLQFYRRTHAAEYEASCAYLRQHQQANGCWESYWWSSPVYATAYAVLALAGSATSQTSRAKGLEWLASQQLDTGAWADLTAGGQGSCFYTALALKALLSDETGTYLPASERGATWLLGRQTTDGSWTTSRILRIPATNVSQPNQVRQWRNSSFGVNVLVDDHNRIFTTATVFNALGAFASRREKVAI